MAAPDEVTVWIGLDVGKEEHFADVLNDAGESLFARSIRNDEAALDALTDQASEHGAAGLVIDQPGSIAQLAIAVAARRQVPVAYVPGLVMRRAADLSGRGQDGPPRRVRDRRHRPHPADQGALARHQQ